MYSSGSLTAIEALEFADVGDPSAALLPELPKTAVFFGPGCTLMTSLPSESSSEPSGLMAFFNSFFFKPVTLLRTEVFSSRRLTWPEILLRS